VVQRRSTPCLNSNTAQPEVAAAATPHPSMHDAPYVDRTCVVTTLASSLRSDNAPVQLARGPGHWMQALKKGMKTVQPAFKILDDGASAPVSHQRIGCHIVWDVKMDLTRMVLSSPCAPGSRCDWMTQDA